MKRAKFLFSTVLFFTVAMLIVSVNVTAAQTPTPTPSTTVVPNVTSVSTPISTPASTPPPPSTSIPTSDIRVIEAYKFGQEENSEARNSAGIGDIIVIKVSNLQSLVDRAKCLTKYNQKIQGCQEQEIALFLDGRKINGIVPISGAPRPEEATLQFRLQRNANNKDAWADLLGAPPFFSDKFFKRSTEVSVGLEDAYAKPTEVKGETFKLVRIRDWLLLPCLVGLVILLIGMWALAYQSDILRDSGESPTGFDERGRNKRKPFSLARCQMAWWFFWVITSFLFIWLITGVYDIITASVLGLIGIGAGTALGAAAIDVGKREDIKSQLSSLDTLDSQRKTLEEYIGTLDNQIKTTSPPADLNLTQTRETKQTQLEFVKNQIKALTDAAKSQESNGFCKDILTDATGVSFHRFQIFVWTIVLGVLFIYSVWRRLSMPEFSATLLALQGISAGTYLGFKIPEKQA